MPAESNAILGPVGTCSAKGQPRLVLNALADRVLNNFCGQFSMMFLTDGQVYSCLLLRFGMQFQTVADIVVTLAVKETLFLSCMHL